MCVVTVLRTRMKSVLLLSLSICLVYSLGLCKTSHYKTSKEVSKQQVVIDTNEVAIIPFNQDMWWVFDSSYKAASLLNDEIELVDKLLQKCLSDHNRELQQDNQFRWVIDFTTRRYQKQYVAVVNKKGEKIVWVNGFCSPKERWRTEIVSVMDGGPCYFNLKINLASMECFDLRVNGLA
jgi:hypothetical protein